MFSCNRRGFSIACIVFLLLFLLVTVFGRTIKSFFSDILSFVTQEASDQDRTRFIGETKNVITKILLWLVIRDVCGTWHALFTATSIFNIRKSTSHSQKLGKKLTITWQIFKGQKREKSSWLIHQFYHKSFHLSQNDYHAMEKNS